MGQVARLFALSIVLGLVPSTEAFAANRIALLIGNKGYAPSVGVLINPHNDVDVVAKVLRGAQL